MAQNISSAVMAQRSEPHDSLDFFPTPRWATRALLESHLNLSPGRDRVWEPACGECAMSQTIAEYTKNVFASDVHNYGCGQDAVHDFLMPFVPLNIPVPDWVITNPPFRLAEQFVIRGLEIATEGVAVLVRSVFIESAVRYESLFRDRPPTIMAQFVERVAMVKGRLDSTAASATSYCWLIWSARSPSLVPILAWIPPCRSRLDRASDWPVTEAAE